MGSVLSNKNCPDYLKEEVTSEEESDDNEMPQNLISSKNRNGNPDMTDNCFDSATDTFDAAPPNVSMTIRLNLDQVEIIENTLDVYEKVSVLFLVLSDPNLALKKIAELIENNNEQLIYKWARQQEKHSKWPEILVEAICIIQNYEVLRLLNFKKEDLVIRFLPHRFFTSVHISKIRKAFYFVCESLNQNEVENMLKLLYPHFVKKNLTYINYNLEYLERYILYWESIGFIQNNLSNICSILKQMGHLALYDMLKTLMPLTDDSKTSEILFDEILNPTCTLSQLTSLKSMDSSNNIEAKKYENKYYIDANNPGVCLIINQENFYREIEPRLQHLLPSGETKLESRTGTQRDKDQIKETFCRFGYKTIAVDNLIHSEVLKKIEEVVMNITEESSLFVFILSHGDKGVIYGVNSCRISVEEIKRIMVTRNREHLDGKPKVLILQSCQGTRCQKIFSAEQDEIVTDGPTFPSKESIPPWVDLFTFWSTVPGYAAIRNKNTGSWFIQSLCDKMSKLATSHHFEDICTIVVNDVSSKKWIKTKEPVAMVPLKVSTLRIPFYLPPLRN